MTIKKIWKLWPPFEVFRYATASPIFSVESRTSEECVDLFFCFPIRVTLTIIVVEHIELDPSNNPAREGHRFTTCGPLTKTVAHPWPRFRLNSQKKSSGYLYKLIQISAWFILLLLHVNPDPESVAK